MKHIIVGGGIAGTTAVEELRKLLPDDEIILIDEEEHPLYSKVLLPHYIDGRIERDKVFVKKESWYQEKNIEWLRGLSVKSLDTKNKHVVLSDNREIPYNTLILATGGDVRLIEGDPRGVVYFRTLDDADHMLQIINEQGNDARAVIYGGSFIACDFLTVFAKHQIPTSVVFRGPHFWSHSLEKEAGEFVSRHLERQGVKLYPRTTLGDFVGDKELAGIQTDKGRIDCSILAVAIGVLPNISFAQEAGIDCAKSIRCDSFLETNVKDVYAIGDVAEFFDETVGRHRTVGSWFNAIAQARIVAKTIAGDRQKFIGVSSYLSDALGLPVIFIGDVEKAAADKVELEKITDGQMKQTFYRKDRLVGAVLIGTNKEWKEIEKKILTEGLKN